jgi:hypothetical protein
LTKFIFLALLLIATSRLSAQVFTLDSSDIVKIDYLIDRNDYLEAKCAKQDSIIQRQNNGLIELKNIIIDAKETILRQDIQITACRNAPKEITVQESFSILKAIGVGAIGVVIGIVVAFIVKVN